MNVKNNIIQCPSCLFQFSSINWLIKHLRQIKNVCFCAEQYPCNTFCCKFCPLNLRTANELADHLEVFHCQTENNCEEQELNSCINENNTHRIFNYCKFCTKYFKRNSDLQRHELIHTGERPFKCSQCFLSFRTKQTLQTHQKTHLNTPSEQYQCSFCQKYFLSRSSLKLHLRIHTGEAPFKCQNEQCFEMFRTKKLMLTHYKNTHFEQFLQQNGQIIEKPINITEKQKSNIAALDNHFIALNELLKLNKKIGGPKKARKCLTQSENSAFSKFGINKKFDCRRGREIEEEEEQEQEEEVVNEGFINSFETINGGHEQVYIYYN